MVYSTHIYLRNVRLYAFHGVMPQERVVGGEYVVNLDVKAKVAEAIQSDRVEDTIDFAVMHDIVVREMAIPSQLLEHVAGRIGNALLETFTRIEEVEVDICKVTPPFGGDCDGAGVKLQLNRVKG